MIPLPSGNDNIAHIHVLRRSIPTPTAQPAAFVEPMDYITARLTGRVRNAIHGVRAVWCATTACGA